MGLISHGTEWSNRTIRIDDPIDPGIDLVNRYRESGNWIGGIIAIIPIADRGTPDRPPEGIDRQSRTGEVVSQAKQQRHRDRLMDRGSIRYQLTSKSRLPSTIHHSLSTMNQPDKTMPNTAPISTKITHIKLYSDNPIHDAIDSIIESCTGLDEANDHSFFYALSLKAAAEELCELAYEIATKETDKYRRGIYNEQPDKTEY